MSIDELLNEMERIVFDEGWSIPVARKRVSRMCDLETMVNLRMNPRYELILNRYAKNKGLAQRFITSNGFKYKYDEHELLNELQRRLESGEAWSIAARKCYSKPARYNPRFLKLRKKYKFKGRWGR